MSLKELQLVDFLSWIILIIFLLVVLFMVYQIAQLSNDKQETGNPVETADEPPLENDPVQMEFVPVLLWIIYSIIPLLLILCVILYLYCQPGNIQETGNPVETAEGEPDKLLQYPTQETQEPGVHPSMKFNVFLENERERFLATQANHERYEWEAQEEDSEVEEENRDTDEEREEPAQELLAYASQVVSNNSELVKGEKAKTEESEEQPSPAAKGAESAKFPLDTTNVPGDMDHSDTATGEEAKTEESEEQPSPAAKAAESAKLPLDTTKVPGHVDHSDTDATGEEAKTEESEEHSSPAAKGAESAKLPLDTTNVPGDVDHSDTDATAEAIADAQTASMTANPGNKEKKKGKKVFGERSSGDHAAVADDPDTSTDKSHHSSIEAFCSSDSDGQKQRSRKV